MVVRFIYSWMFGKYWTSSQHYMHLLHQYLLQTQEVLACTNTIQIWEIGSEWLGWQDIESKDPHSVRHLVCRSVGPFAMSFNNSLNVQNRTTSIYRDVYNWKQKRGWINMNAYTKMHIWWDAYPKMHSIKCLAWHV